MLKFESIFTWFLSSYDLFFHVYSTERKNKNNNRYINVDRKSYDPIGELDVRLKVI